MRLAANLIQREFHGITSVPRLWLFPLAGRRVHLFPSIRVIVLTNSEFFDGTANDVVVGARNGNNDKNSTLIMIFNKIYSTERIAKILSQCSTS